MFLVRLLKKCKRMNPVVVILGSTGSGKSKLSIELAQKFNGEIINADAMQMYKGLDIVTNKVTAVEMALSPHHMMSFLDPHHSNYNIINYKKDASIILKDIHARGKVPIIVGGTNYYIEALLWDFVLPLDAHSPSLHEDNEDKTDNDSTSKECGTTAQKNNRSQDVSDEVSLHEQLRRVDARRADQIHPNDVRKVKRALEVYKSSGKTMTSFFQRQHQEDEEAVLCTAPLRGRLMNENTCIIWVKSDQEVLNKRLDARVDEMVQRGLLQELLDFYHNTPSLSLNKGLLQSIGFKEFHAYLTCADKQSKEAATFYEKGLEEMKVATRQYSKRQVKWIRNRFLKEHGSTSLPPVYLVDSSHPDQWLAHVHTPASDIVGDFLQGKKPRAKELDRSVPDNPTVHRTCLECGRVFVKQKEWTIHIGSRKHKKRLQKLKSSFNVKKRKEGDDSRGGIGDKGESFGGFGDVEVVCNKTIKDS